MNIDYGFAELFAKDDKMMGKFFKESNNRDILGLYKMNVRISNVLFPFGNTLMPNLVYFYYLNAIYYVLKEKNGREPYRHEIDEWEIKISKAIKGPFKSVRKGFLDKASNRAYSKYKSSMERMHFIGNNGTVKAEEWKARPELEKTALECLKETKRYKFVKRIVTGLSEKVEFSAEEQMETWPYRLENIERLDFIRRVVVPYENDFVPYSVFSNIVMYCSMIKQRPRRMETIYKDDWIETYEKKRNGKKEVKIDNSRKYDFGGIKTFDNLTGYFDYINSGYSGINRNEDYRVASAYSKLQLIAKLVYKVCLFEGSNERQGDYLNQLQEEIRKLHMNEEVLQFNNFARNFQVKKKYYPFLVKSNAANEFDNELLDAFQFVGKLAVCMKSFQKSENFDTIINEMKKIVIEREAEVMGDNSILNSGIRTEHTRRDSEDTFRWQYRPDYVFMDGGNTKDEEDSGNAQTVNEEKNSEKNDNAIGFVWKKGDKKEKLSTMSASYYIYELFFEPYEA